MGDPVYQHEGEVPVILPDGSPGYVPKAALHDVEKSGGQALGKADAQRLQQHENFEAQYDNAEGAIAPVVAGAARGASLGLSDVALGTFGGDRVRRKLLDYQDYAPKASMAGEVAGVVIPSLFGEEAGLTGAVSKVGKGAERAVAEGLGGGLLARTAGRAAGGAAEGALYAEGKAAGDAALHNEQLTTEKALAAAGHGLIFGAGANVLLGGAGAGLSKLLSREEGAAAGLATRAEGAVQREGTGLGDALQTQRDNHVFKALGGTKSDVMAAERNVAGGYRKVADDVFNVVEAKGGRFATQSKTSINDIVTEELEKAGERQGAMLKKLDELGTGSPDIKGLTSKIREELITPHMVQTPSGAMVLPGKETGVEVAESWIKKLDGAFGEKPPTFEQLHEMRRAVDEKVNWARANKDPSQKAYAQIRSIMEKELETSGEAAAKNAGGAFVDEYQAGKSLYQSLRIAKDLSDRGVAGQVNNNAFGLGAMISGGAGLAAGGPLGGMAMGLAGKLVKDRGDMLAADLLHRAANLAGVTRLAAQTDATLSRGVASLLGKKAPATIEAGVRSVRIPSAPMGVALSGNLRGDFKKVSAAVVEAQTNTAQTVDKVARALGPEASKSPKIAAAATQLVLGDIDYLHKQLPPPRLDAYSLQPHLQKDSRASEAEMSKWMQTAEVLANPTMVLDEAKAGTLSRTHVEALKERRPEMYQQIRTEVLEQVVNTTEEIPYDRRIQLGILLDIPTDRTLAPDFQQAIQATYSSAEQAGEESPSPQLARPLAMASAHATPLVGAMSEGLEK